MDILKPFTAGHKRAYATSFAAGCLAALSMAPASFWPILLVSIPILYGLIAHASTKRRAFITGWLFGFGYFLCSLSWIGNALLVEGNGYRWAWPLAISGIPFILAFYWGLAALLWQATKNWRPCLRWISFATIFGITEVIRGIAFTGFPWNLLAYALANHLTMIQISAAISAYGLTALVWLWASAPALLVSKNAVSTKAVVLLLSAASITATFLYGQQRLAQEDSYALPPINIKTIPGNITQSERWKRDQLIPHFLDYIKQSTNHDFENPPQKPTLIVWPETAMLDWYYKDPGLAGYIQEMLHSYPAGAALISGALRSGAQGRTYNSIVMIDQDGRISNIYDKTHLVPFGEYIPFQNLIPLAPVNNFSGFAKGKGASLYNTPFGISYAPAVCYEIIFPYSLLPASKRPDFIINVTNDAWYEGSAGPDQHYAQVLFRAIEYNLPIIRVANMGVSGVISPYGRMIQP